MFNDWQFDHQIGTLKRQNESHKLPPRLSKLLLLLTDNAGQLVERQEIIADLWAGKVVNDDALARCIAELRSILGDKSQSPTYIETIPRRGYRFIAPIKAHSNNRQKHTLIVAAISVLIIAVAAFLWLQRGIQQSEVDWRKVIAQGSRVTAEAEMEIHPELSSSGRTLTYSVIENETYVVKIVDLTGKQKFQISAPQAHLLSPVLSPKEDRLLALEFSSEGCKVVLFDLPELSKQALTGCALPNPSSALEWTKGGDGFLYVNHNGNKQSTSLWSFDLATKREKQLTFGLNSELFDTRPRISPDGNYVSFQRGTKSIQNIYVQAFDDANTLKQVTQGKNRKMSHQWSTDGNSILFDSNTRGDKNLWIVDLDSLQLENLGARDGQYPMLSNDGNIFAYQEARYQANLWLYDIENDIKTQLVASPKYDNYPTYAPNGKSIAFTTNKYGESEIWIYDFEQQMQRLLLSIPDKSLLSPQWSISGKKLLFGAVSEDGYECFELVLATGLYTQIGDDQVPVSSCYNLADEDNVNHSINAGEASHETSLQHLDIRKQLFRDGASRVRALNSQTYIYTRTDSKGLFQYSVAQQRSNVLIPDYPKSFNEQWEISNQRLYYRYAQEPNQVWRYDFATQSHHKVLDTGKLAAGGVIAVSPDEKYLVISEQGSNQGSIFVTELDRLN